MGTAAPAGPGFAEGPIVLFPSRLAAVLEGAMSLVSPTGPRQRPGQIMCLEKIAQHQVAELECQGQSVRVPAVLLPHLPPAAPLRG